MKPIIIAIALLTWTGAAQAQQQITPSQMAIQIDNAVNGLASSVEVLQAQLKQAQATATDDAKQIADLKAAAAQVDCTAPDQKAAPAANPGDKP